MASVKYYKNFNALDKFFISCLNEYYFQIKGYFWFLFCERRLKRLSCLQVCRINLLNFYKCTVLISFYSRCWSFQHVSIFFIWGILLSRLTYIRIVCNVTLITKFIGSFCPQLMFLWHSKEQPSTVLFRITSMRCISPKGIVSISKQPIKSIHF